MVLRDVPGLSIDQLISRRFVSLTITFKHCLSEASYTTHKAPRLSRFKM